MVKDNKRLFLYLSILLFAILISCKLPHDTYSIAEYIIRPIRINEGSYIFPSAILILILFIIGIRGIMTLDRFENANKFLIFILVIALIIPAMKLSVDFIRNNYFYAKDGLEAVDFNKSDISIVGMNDKISLQVNLELVNHGNKVNEFRIRVYLPEYLRKYAGTNEYAFDTLYRIYPNQSNMNIRESIPLKDSSVYDNFIPPHWLGEEVRYDLYNDEETVRIVDHGL